MRFIVLPIEDAKLVFTEEELDTIRKNVNGTEVIVHEEILISKRQNLGLSPLPDVEEEDDNIKWTYPVYEYNSDKLNTLLNSSEWKNEEEHI